MISSVQSPSFKACVPVQIYAKNPNTGKYSPLRKKDNDSTNIRKCQRFVVSNLNGTAKTKQDNDFVNFYKGVDKDYSLVNIVEAHYNNGDRKEIKLFDAEKNEIGKISS